MTTATATRKTSSAIALYEGGIHSRIEIAIRADGARFDRGQDCGPYGYRWSAWRKTGMTVDVTVLPSEIQAGFSVCRRRYSGKDPGSLRLPIG